MEVNAYGYCAEDPVNRFDLYGREWKTKEDKSIANKLSEKIIERQGALTRKKDRIEKRLNKINHDRLNDKKNQRMGEAIKDIDLQMATLEDLSNGILEMESSSITYTFNTVDNGETAFLFSMTDGTIVINNYGTIGNRAHEITHAIQYERGLLTFYLLGGNIVKPQNRVSLSLLAKLLIF